MGEHMKTFTFTALSPEGVLFEGEVYSVLLRSSEGDMAVYSGHIPLAAVCPGKFVLTKSDGEKQEGITEGGILIVEKEKTTLLSSSIKLK